MEMASSEGGVDPTLLDLETLESRSAPTFVIKTGISGSKALEFELLFCNQAFRESGLKDVVLAQDKDTLLFRCWTQALGKYTPRFEFAGRSWTAKVAGKSGFWKVIEAAEEEEEEEVVAVLKEEKSENGGGMDSVKSADSHAELGADGQTAIFRRSKDELLDEVRRYQEAVRKDIAVSSENLTARWESIQTMMEMSDVGVFEYSLEGKLIHANEAWYRLSSHPRNPPSHVQYSFMDLVYPDDQALVMSMWNSLVSGFPVTFEMRWKPPANSTDSAQWILSACVPVLDEKGNLISIAGNTIDINAQKKSQEVAQARVEALEQARLSELKFARFAQLSPTAIYIFVPESGMTFCNDRFFELTGHSRDSVEKVEWAKVIADEDVQMVEESWTAIARGGKSEAIQFRLRKTWTNQDGQCSNVWVESSSHPELDEKGNVISIMGTLFDISQFKWAENVQQRRIKEAVEAKRQQENFIDMTSHELRNPLSAVVQCADSVITTLRTTPLFNSDQAAVRDDIIDSLQTIVQCSVHQKRVIDDVLTLSKLDSDLILITPTRTQPAVVVSDAMKLFDMECSQMKIKLEFRLDESFRGLDWAMIDPSRLLQILFNLITNAIKFTKDRPTRKVSVTLGGSWTRPPKCWQNITFTNHELPEVDILDRPEWGTGKKAYLWLQVADTGCGMTLDEQTKLFSRFSQATPRTHVKYGGSGLGLFISKSLATLQGGAIGVHSETNVGSVFAFFVGTRVADPPLQKRTKRSNSSSPTPSSSRPGLVRMGSCEDAMCAVKLNVLIVEDNLVNQKVLRKQLQRFGWNVNVAGNGQEALEWLKGSVYWRGGGDDDDDVDGQGNEHLHSDPDPPHPHSNPDPDTNTNTNLPKPKPKKHPLDIILMDIEMPIMDGLACTRMIRSYEQQGLLAPPSSHPHPHLHLHPATKPSTESPTQPPTQPPTDSSSVHHSNGSSNSNSTPRLPILAVSANARAEQVGQAVAAGMDDAIAKPFRIPELWPKIKGLVRSR